MRARIVYKKFVHYFPKVNTTVMKGSGHRFFLSIPVQAHLADAMRRYPDLENHIREASKWGPAHVTIAMFESYMPVDIVTRTLTETLSRLLIAPLSLVVGGHGTYMPGRNQILVFRGKNRELKKVRRTLYAVAKHFALNEKSFSHQKKHALSSTFHIGVGQTMPEKKLKEIARFLRGKEIPVESLELEVREVGDRSIVVDRTPLLFGKKAGASNYRIVYQHSPAHA
jgi:hypothetical protein